MWKIKLINENWCYFICGVVCRVEANLLGNNTLNYCNIIHFSSFTLSKRWDPVATQCLLSFCKELVKQNKEDKKKTKPKNNNNKLWNLLFKCCILLSNTHFFKLLFLVIWQHLQNKRSKNTHPKILCKNSKTFSHSLLDLF